jgi:hypothetical protein
VDVTSLHDLRGALRTWKTRPLFAVLVTGTVGVSLGLATAAFSLLDAILLRPLPYVDSDRLIRVYTLSTQVPCLLHGASLPDSVDWRQHVRGLAPMAAWVTSTIR